MNINSFKNLYEENKKLDSYFIKECGNNENIVLKNKLELLVELGELANETKCFKYWLKKEPNKELVLLEYADVTLMTLYFFRELDISLDEDFPEENDLDLINEFMYLYEKLSMFNKQYNKDLIKDVFINILRLGKLLNITEEEIIKNCLNKIKLNKERFNFND